MTFLPTPSLHCVALMATKDRWSLLTQRALPSIRDQERQPEAVYLVNDGAPFTSNQRQHVAELLNPVPVTILANACCPGAAGAWNTGLRHLRSQGYDGYVAILDDDDGWDSRHVLVNLAVAQASGAHVVVSGLRRVVAGQVVERNLPANLTVDDFLRGNPGLQGSNTFVAVSTLDRAGDFTDGLASLNDRDLAVRLLSLPDLRIAYTGEWTATWYHGDAPAALSTPRSLAKIAGLQAFWRMHGPKMSTDTAAAYFDRAWRFFGVSQEEILEGAHG